MFVSRGDRDLGVAFLIHPGSQSLSRGEAKDSALLSSCDGYLLEPTEWPKGRARNVPKRWDSLTSPTEHRPVHVVLPSPVRWVDIQWRNGPDRQMVRIERARRVRGDMVSPWECVRD